MILTGLAKDDFLSWYGTGEHYFTVTLKSIEQYANIVEWLDGVGVYVSTTRELNGEFSFSTYNDLNEDPTHIGWTFSSRQQATEAAIKLANKIYNNR